VNAESGYGQKPLLLAVMSAKVPAVQELLKHGANPDIRDFLDKPLLQVALEEKQKCETRCSPTMKNPRKRIRNLSEIIEILENTSQDRTENSGENSSNDNSNPARIFGNRG
jgi:ankyrin repeat protein